MEWAGYTLVFKTLIKIKKICIFNFSIIPTLKNLGFISSMGRKWKACSALRKTLPFFFTAGMLIVFQMCPFENKSELFLFLYKTWFALKASHFC